MAHPGDHQHICIDETPTSHPNNPIPEEPTNIPLVTPNAPLVVASGNSSIVSGDVGSASDSESPGTPATDASTDGGKVLEDAAISVVSSSPSASSSNETMAPPTPSTPRKRRASTVLISQSPEDVHRILSPKRIAQTREIERVCCGGGCCFLDPIEQSAIKKDLKTLDSPDNDAFRSLRLRLGLLSLDTELTHLVDIPPQTVSFDPIPSGDPSPLPSTVSVHPPRFVTPHPPYEVYPAKLHHARELTKPGAEKRTYHFDLDVTDYPSESGDVDFVVGGAIGVQAPNAPHLVDEIFDLLHIPNFVRDKPVTVNTSVGRWPTIWGDEVARRLVTTRRELLTWCSDIQSYPPTKALLRLLGEHASDPVEKKILLYLCSAQGQPAFCDLRTGPHLTVAQLLTAFPSSQPPLPHLLSVLNTLMPRFYSLSQDPQISCQKDGSHCRRLIEIAVTVHETPDWRGGSRTGLGSGFLERLAQQIQKAEKDGVDVKSLDIHVPMFRGLMANPLAREFVTDGPMLLVGAGVGVAPFRGFVQRRLRAANCANKVWVLQGVRDSLLDELYNGEWGVEESQVKKVVQSRRGEGKYVQDEVRHQADLVWFIINALDGRVFVCGSSKGMGEGVEKALVDVAMDKGNLRKEEAVEFWEKKKEAGQYIASSHAANYVATQMALAHNGILRGLNSIYLQAAQIPAGDVSAVRDFLTYCQCWSESMHHHHDAEEEIFFPALERISKGQANMQSNIEQHRAFTPGFDRFQEYCRTCVPGDYDGQKLRSLVEGFADPLTRHLHDEIGTLRALNEFPSEQVRQAYRSLEKSLMATDNYRIAPLVFGTADRNFENGTHNFPAVPFFVPYIINYVFAQRYRGVWRYNPCTIFRDRRELAFTA